MQSFLFLCLFTFAAVFSTKAQRYDKSYRLADQGIHTNKSIMLHDGHLLHTGFIASNTTFHDIAIIKTNFNNGDTIWNKAIHANNMNLNGMKIIELQNRHLLIAANGVDSGTANKYNHVLLIELDSNGTLLKSSIYNNLGGYSGMYVTGLSALPNNQYMAIYVSYDSLGMVVQKFDGNSNLLFSKSIRIKSTAGLSGGNLFDVIQKGDYYYFIGNSNFDSNSPDLLMMKTDTAGNVVWLKSSFTGILASLYIVSGNFIQTTDDTLQFVLGNGVSASLVRADTSGVIHTFKAYFNAATTSSVFQPYFKAVYQTASGDLLMSGITDFQFNPNISTHVGKAFILKLDASGNILWCKKYSEANNYNSVTLIGQASGQDIWIGGSAYDFVTLNPANTHPRLYTMRLDSAGNVATGSCGNDSNFVLSIAAKTQNLRNEFYEEKNAASMISFNAISYALPLTISNLGLSTGVTINILPTVICQGSNATISVLSNVNAGNNPTYKFYVNHQLMQTSTLSTYLTNVLNQGDTIQCEIISNALCVSPANVLSNIIVAKIYPTFSPDITISASPSTEVKAGQAITFTAVPTNEGPTPYYVWKKNGIKVGNNSTVYYLATPAQGDMITCDVSSSTCATTPTATSNALKVIIQTTSNIEDQYNQLKQMRVYPNPVESYMHIVANITMRGKILIYDALGRICLQWVMDKNELIVPIDLEPGLYKLVLMDVDGKVVGMENIIRVKREE